MENNSAIPGITPLPEELVEENLERVVNELNTSINFKGTLPSECRSKDHVILDTIAGPSIGDIYVLKDIYTNQHRYYIYTGEWIRMRHTVEDLSMTITDLLEYLYDVKDYLDKHSEIQTKGSKEDTVQNIAKVLSTASDMVQFIIDKVNDTEEEIQ